MAARILFGKSTLDLLVPCFASIQNLSHVYYVAFANIECTRALRYVLKNKETGDVFFVVVFHLVPKEDVDKENLTGGETKEEKKEGGEGFQPKDDDLD